MNKKKIISPKLVNIYALIVPESDEHIAGNDKLVAPPRPLVLQQRPKHVRHGGVALDVLQRPAAVQEEVRQT